MSTTEGPFGDPGRANANTLAGMEASLEERHLPSNRLTPMEIEAVRELIESDKRARWFWSSIRIWLSWISGVLVAIYAIWDQVEKFMKKFTG